MLSPWDAPRYLWAAIEGAGGLDVTGSVPKINPCLSEQWRWLTAVNVPYRDTQIAWIATRMPDGLHVYTTSDLASDGPLTAYASDITDACSVADPLVTLVGFADAETTLIFLGNSSPQTITTAATIAKLPRDEHSVRIFSTVWNQWQDAGRLKRDDILDGIAVVIDAGGFCLIEINQP